MLTDRGARGRLLVFILLTALCGALLAVSDTAPVRELRRGVNYAVSPIQGTLAAGTRSVADVLGAFGEIDTLRRENQDLHDEVERLADELATLDSVREENERLARLLETRAALAHATVAARVTARFSTLFERTLTIDRGAAAGIVEGAPVLSEGGALAGSVTDVGEGWSAVRLISDTRSLVIGLDGRTGASGEVGGRLSSPLAMRNIKVTDDVDVDDRIVTAGYDLGRRFRSFYPRGLPIGRVVDVQQDPGAIVQTAYIEASADLDHLEDVLVLVDFDPPRRPRQASDGS